MKKYKFPITIASIVGIIGASCSAMIFYFTEVRANDKEVAEIDTRVTLVESDLRWHREKFTDLKSDIDLIREDQKQILKAFNIKSSEKTQ